MIYKPGDVIPKYPRWDYLNNKVYHLDAVVIGVIQMKHPEDELLILLVDGKVIKTRSRPGSPLRWKI